MSKKLNVTLDNVASKQLDSKRYNEENLKEKA